MQKFFLGVLVVTSLSLLFVLFGFIASGLMLSRITREFTPIDGDQEVCSALDKEKGNSSQETAQIPPNLDWSEIEFIDVKPKTLREFERDHATETSSSFITCPGLVEALDGQNLDQLKVLCPCKRGRLASCALALLTCIIQLALNVAIIVTVFILKRLTEVKKIWMINSILFGVCLVFCAIALALAVQFTMKDSPDDLESVFAFGTDPNVDGLVYFIWICMDLVFCLIALIVLLVLKILSKSKSAQDGNRRSTVASTPSNNSKGGASGASGKSRGTRSSSRGKSRGNKNAVAPHSQSQIEADQNKSQSDGTQNQTTGKSTPSGTSVKKNQSNRNIK